MMSKEEKNTNKIHNMLRIISARFELNILQILHEISASDALAYTSKHSYSSICSIFHCFESTALLCVYVCVCAVTVNRVEMRKAMKN